MANIIKISDYQRDAVIVGDRHARRFTPTHFRDQEASEPGPLEETPLQPDELETATAQAERIVAEAEARAAAITREAMTRGYADGMAQGLRAAEEQSREHLQRLAEVARRAGYDREAMVRSAREDLAALALGVAARVIRREVSADPATVLSVLESALERVPFGESVRILVHPEDAELVRARWSDLRSAVAFEANWEVGGDDRMERGGCVIETRGGAVDARLESQLARIAEAFEVEWWPR